VSHGSHHNTIINTFILEVCPGKEGSYLPALDLHSALIPGALRGPQKITILSATTMISYGKLTGWLGTIISKAVRALAARLVQRQRIFVTTPWLCLFGALSSRYIHSIVYILVLSLAALLCVE